MGIAAILVMRTRPFEQTFTPLSHGGSIWNVASIGLAVSKVKISLKMLILIDLEPRSMNDIDLSY